MKLIVSTLAIFCLVASNGAYAARSLGSEQLGTISIPAINLRIPIVKDTGSIEPGSYPMHYSESSMPCGIWTTEIAAHHYTHALSGKDGGPFRHLDQLKAGQAVYIKMAPAYGGKTCKYVQRKQVVVWCGNSWNDIWYCPNSEAYFTNLARRQLILTTCIGDGNERRFVYADLSTT